LSAKKFLLNTLKLLTTITAMATSRRVLPAAENRFINEASQSGLFTSEEIKNMVDDLSTQYVSLESLAEQERLLRMTNDLIDQHAQMLQNYPITFTYLTRRQGALTKHLEDQRERLTLKSEGKGVETEVSLGSRMSKGSNASRVAASSMASGTSSAGGDIPAFRSLPTPRMGGGLT
jgi:hypothetical protein